VAAGFIVGGFGQQRRGPFPILMPLPNGYLNNVTAAGQITNLATQPVRDADEHRFAVLLWWRSASPRDDRQGLYSLPAGALLALGTWRHRPDGLLNWRW
jgi:hypothetical protein